LAAVHCLRQAAAAVQVKALAVLAVQVLAAQVLQVRQ
jgi:hypothetical protein